MVADPNYANTGLQVKPNQNPVCHSTKDPFPLPNRLSRTMGFVKQLSATPLAVRKHFRSLRQASLLLRLVPRFLLTIGVLLHTPIMI